MEIQEIVDGTRFDFPTILTKSAFFLLCHPQVVRHHAGILYQREHGVWTTLQARWHSLGGGGFCLSVPVLQREREAVEDGWHGAPGGDKRQQSCLQDEAPHGVRCGNVCPSQSHQLHSPGQHHKHAPDAQKFFVFLFFITLSLFSPHKERPGAPSLVVLLVCVLGLMSYVVAAAILHKLDQMDLRRAAVVPLCGCDGLFKYEIQIKTGWSRGAGRFVITGFLLANHSKSQPMQSGNIAINYVGYYQLIVIYTFLEKNEVETTKLSISLILLLMGLFE